MQLIFKPDADIARWETNHAAGNSYRFQHKVFTAYLPRINTHINQRKPDHAHIRERTTQIKLGSAQIMLYNLSGKFFNPVGIEAVSFIAEQVNNSKPIRMLCCQRIQLIFKYNRISILIAINKCKPAFSRAL